ncbi:MAG: DUF1232 domain-containing protein [Firmicutes bacterium]|nr:DUF1232 domain-containing protein [Bacillota bacterium]
MGYLRKIPLAFKYVFDGEVALKNKIWIIFGLIYLVSPIDLIPEPVLGLGIVDDFVLLTFILNKMSTTLENYSYEKQRKKQYKDIKGEIIEDVDYEIKDDE